MGAGVAGCALAFQLGKEGRRVLLLDRDLSEPDRYGVGVVACARARMRWWSAQLTDMPALLFFLHGARSIVGELLQPGGYLKLKELGLGHCIDGIDAQKVLGYCIMKDGESARLGYPTVDGAPVAGYSFHNGRFIMKLREAAVSHPSVVLRQGGVRRLNGPNGEAWKQGMVVKGVQYQVGPDAGTTTSGKPVKAAH